jgi:hypothetical protein
MSKILLKATFLLFTLMLLYSFNQPKVQCLFIFIVLVSLKVSRRSLDIITSRDQLSFKHALIQVHLHVRFDDAVRERSFLASAMATSLCFDLTFLLPT